MIIGFKVNGQELKRLDEKKLASFSRNYIHAFFDFDKEWIDLQKYALFVTPDETKYVAELGYGKELSCKIPSAVLENTFFKISVYAGDLLTSQQQTIMILPSGYTSDLDDLEDGDILESDTHNDFIFYRHNFDEEYCDERLNRFEREEHPYI